MRNAVALTMGVVALGSLTGGILAMAIGQSHKRRAKLEREALGFALQLDLHPERPAGGLVLRGRF